MLDEIGFFALEESLAYKAVADREQAGWRIFRLPRQVASKDDFFDAVRRTLPSDPALQSNRSWDALSDSLWSGLHATPDEKILILWPNSSHMKENAPEDFGIASDILRELPNTLADARYTAGAATYLMVILAV